MPGNTPDNPARRVRVRLASRVKERIINWLWTGWLPWGKLVIWEGDPGEGKSVVSDDIVARATRGDAMPDGTCGGEVVSALLLCAEDGLADTVKPRLAAAGANLEMVALHDDDDDAQGGEFSLPSGCEALRSAIERHKLRTRTARVVVIIDPITAYLDANIDANKDSDVRRLTKRLSRLAETTDSLVILIRHLNKSTQVVNAKYRGSGSIGWTAAARAVYLFGPIPGDPDQKVMAAVKNNIAARLPSIGYRVVVDEPTQMPVVYWTGEVNVVADDLFRVRDARKESPQRDVAESLLLELLNKHGGSVSAARVMTAARARNISKSSVTRASLRLGVIKSKVQTRNGRWVSVWSKPEETPEP